MAAEGAATARRKQYQQNETTYLSGSVTIAMQQTSTMKRFVARTPWMLSIVLSTLGISGSLAETVDVKYRGTVNLKTFSCTDMSRSSFIERVCYDRAQSYMLINLRGTYYHYCELPPATFDAFIAAPSMGQFYNGNIKGTGSDGPFDCRTRRVPQY
jgi:hypothetical protein